MIVISGSNLQQVTTFSSCFLIAILIAFMTRRMPANPNILAIEVFATVVGLFIFGSTRYRIDKTGHPSGGIHDKMIPFSFSK